MAAFAIFISVHLHELFFYGKNSLQCRCILVGQNFVRVRIVVAAIFDFMAVEDWGE